MKRPQISDVVQGQRRADSSTFSTVLVTDWLLLTGAPEFAVMHEVRAQQGAGTLTTNVKWRTASVRTDNPSDWSSAGADRTTENVFVDSFDISGTTTAMWIQAGLVAKASGGVAEAFMRLQAQLTGKSVLVARKQRIVVQARASGDTGYSLFAIGAPFPQGTWPSTRRIAIRPTRVSPKKNLRSSRRGSTRRSSLGTGAACQAFRRPKVVPCARPTILLGW